ncbi:MAG: DUF1731 domain-containing protein [Anaerolineae bacterium]|nr:DUF1731 domain-containing protein [Anaerolineae bacterium]
MRVIITGGTGMIGQALAADLARDGHDVVVLTRDPARARGMSARVRAVGWDGRTAQGWADEVEGAGAVVNLAGQRVAGMNPLAYRWTDARRRAICESRRDPGLAVATAVEAASEKPGVVVQISGVDYYAPTGEIAREDSPPGGRLHVPHLRRVLGAADRARGGVGRAACGDAHGAGAAPRRRGAPAAAAAIAPLRRRASGERPAVVLLGAHHRRGSRPPLPDRHARSARRLQPVRVQPGAQRRTQRDNWARAGEAVFMVVPAFAMRLLYGAMADTLLKGVRALPGRLQELGYRFKFPELEPALRDLLGR